MQILQLEIIEQDDPMYDCMLKFKFNSFLFSKNQTIFLSKSSKRIEGKFILN
jgi:hypothetical protein